MPLSLPDLAQRREVIVQQIAQLGDLRPGCVTGTSGRCGKPGCRCHQPGEPAHGPNFRLTYKADGKTISESLPTPAAIRKAEREVAEFRRFQELSREFVETNTAICRLRPVEEETPNDAGKKTAEAIRQEIGREVDQLLRVVFQERRKTGRLDLEATEMAVRSALHRAGAAALSQLLQFPAPPDEQRTVACPCGQAAHYHQLRTKPVLTAVGRAQVSRPYYWCPNCHAGQFPADVELDIENTEFSPGVRRMQALVGQEAPFDQGREQMKVLAGLEVTAKSVERTAEAIGADIAQREQGEIQKALPVGPSRRRGGADSHPVRANGWDGSSGGEKRDGGSARQDRRANRPIRGKSSWGACSLKRRGISRATRSALPIPPPIPAPSKPPKSLADAFTGKPGNGVGVAPNRRS